MKISWVTKKWKNILKKKKKSSIIFFKILISENKLSKQANYLRN